jgi:glycerol kinase
MEGVTTTSDTWLLHELIGKFVTDAHTACTFGIGVFLLGNTGSTAVR